MKALHPADGTLDAGSRWGIPNRAGVMLFFRVITLTADSVLMERVHDGQLEWRWLSEISDRWTRMALD